MPAPRKVISSSAEVLRAASAAQVRVDLLLRHAGGQVELAAQADAPGMPANSSSIDATPISSSIRRRSSSVSDV